MPNRVDERVEVEPLKENVSGSPKETTLGVGADLFIRKKAPGAKVGGGYVVDVYENGVKQDTLELKNKLEVTELIREFKEKYRTDRAFQNELQVHITYKTKEERGEITPGKKEKKIEEEELKVKEKPISRIPREKSIPKEKRIKQVLPTKGEGNTMATIDNVLYKQASQIHGLLQRLLNPELPVKVRIAEDGIDPSLESVSSVPETPAPEGVTDDKTQIKSFIVDEIVKKYTAFVKDRASQGQQALDDLYNPLKQWYGKLARKIEEWNRLSNGAFNVDDIYNIVEETEKVLLSKDPGLISKVTSIQVDQIIADLMYEVGSKSVGTKSDAEKGGELGGDPEIERAASINDGNDIEKGIAEFTKQIQTTLGESTPIEELFKDMDIKDDRVLKAMYDVLKNKDKKTESDIIAETFLCEELYEKTIESKAKDFWKYASSTQGVLDIEDAFMDWLSNKGFNRYNVVNIWNKISKDVIDLFSIREASFYLANNDVMNQFDLFIHSVFGAAEATFQGDIPRENVIAQYNLKTIFDTALYECIALTGKIQAKRLVKEYQQGAADHILEIKDHLMTSGNENTVAITRIINENLPSYYTSEGITGEEKQKYIISLIDPLIKSALETWNNLIQNPELDNIFLKTIQDLLKNVVT